MAGCCSMELINCGFELRKQPPADLFVRVMFLGINGVQLLDESLPKGMAHSHTTPPRYIILAG